MSDYRVKGTDLASVADAIRTKGGTSESLSFPDGFVSAIMDIPTPPPTPSYGGIPIYIDDAYFPSSSGQKISEALSDEDFFLAGPFDTGSSASKSMTYSQMYAGKTAALYLFDDLGGISVDYWGVWGTDKPSVPTSKTVTTTGRYVVTSVLKSRAADFYIMDANGNYLVKGSNVT